ncbi:putative GST-like protein YibF [Roseobacter fucihabitans]|uniref:GST-like protein YibF n=1 Tax=Roseobacter fucihabitans TaxID=1537242 RepID=A0ABZ2BP44_9RHOB|nr:glutathione S-transferase [Roseobacter litoralis]MBC6964729.1 putative GST-like protein YibF [Roseobacter litoralis]
MKLFHSPASPFVRKVVVLLHELEKADDVEQVAVSTTAFASDPGLVAINPLAKLPALVRDNGTTLYDSRVITAFLNDLYGGKMYPTGTTRWESLTLEATGDGIMDCAVSMAYETRLRPVEKQSEPWLDAQWAKIERAVSVLNARWISHLSGPVDMGHISVACALSYVDLRHDARNWRAGNETLAKWHAEFDSRPSMGATKPPVG